MCSVLNLTKFRTIYINKVITVEFCVDNFLYLGKTEVVKKLETDEIYISPYGLCKTLKKTGSRIGMECKESCYFFLVDPAKDNRIRISNMDNGKGAFGPFNDVFFSGQNFEIELSLHDHSIHNGDTCFDYERSGTTYGDCIADAMKESFLKLYNCIPPWLVLNSSQTCNNEITVQDEDYLKEIKGEITRLIKVSYF